MNETLSVQADDLARPSSILLNGLAEAESVIPIHNEGLAVLAALVCTDSEIDCPAFFNRTAGISDAATD
jgi:hypothetical protein